MTAQLMTIFGFGWKVNSMKILDLPSVRAIFKGVVRPLFRDDCLPVSLLVYGDADDRDVDELRTTIGILDFERDLYFEISFRGDRVVACRKYTPDNFCHGVSLRSVRDKYLELIVKRLPSDIYLRIFGLFLPEELGVDRHAGGCVMGYVDSEGKFREKVIEIENKYL